MTKKDKLYSQIINDLVCCVKEYSIYAVRDQEPLKVLSREFPSSRSLYLYWLIIRVDGGGCLLPRFSHSLGDSDLIGAW